jgi:hypothetical protein
LGAGGLIGRLSLSLKEADRPILIVPEDPGRQPPAKDGGGVEIHTKRPDIRQPRPTRSMAMYDEAAKVMVDAQKGLPYPKAVMIGLIETVATRVEPCMDEAAPLVLVHGRAGSNPGDHVAGHFGWSVEAVGAERRVASVVEPILD